MFRHRAARSLSRSRSLPRSRCPSARYVARAAIGVLTLTLFACGSAPRADEIARNEGDLVAGIPPDQLPRVAAELAAAGRIAYYLGPTAAGHDFDGIAWIDNQGPLLIIEANYGPCDPGVEGYCGDPISVSTQEWEQLPTGFPCARLEPRLSVPTAVISGQLHLFTGRLQVKIVDDADLDVPDRPVENALALVAQLRNLSGTEPLGQLPPPAPEVVAWLDQSCPADD